MRLQYASDLHLESSKNFRFVMSGGLEAAGDLLVLSGDIAPLSCLEKYDEFWDWCAEKFSFTVFVPGNHDYYGRWQDFDAFAAPIRRSIRKNVLCAANAVVRVEDCDIIASTLWSKIAPEHQAEIVRILLDFHQIEIGERPLTAADFNLAHERSRQFLQRAVAESTARHVIVATHHVPSFSVVAPQHKDSPLTTGFASELGSWIAESPIECWIYGHSHTSVEGVIGKTKILSNQLGYVKINEPSGYPRAKFVDIGE